MTADFVARLSVDWWKNAGERTRARLDDIVQHYAGVYAIPADVVRSIQENAWRMVPAFMKPKETA